MIGSRSAMPARRRFLLGVAGAAALMMPTRGVMAASPLRIGLTPVFLDDQVGFLERWRRYLEARIGRPVRFVQRASYAEVLRLLLEGQADFAWLCGFPYWRNRDRLQLVAVPVWRGAPLYRSYLIRNAAHEEIAEFANLRGRTFAYSDPDSNSGFLYVQHRLRETVGLARPFFGRTFFTGAHRRVVESVSVQLAQAGAVDGYVWEVLSSIAPALTAGTRILEQSREFGFPPIVAHQACEPAALAGMRQVLLAMAGDAEGQALLASLALDGFEIASPALYEGIGAMADAL